jgi:hypothetical protein
MNAILTSHLANASYKTALYFTNEPIFHSLVIFARIYNKISVSIYVSISKWKKAAFITPLGQYFEIQTKYIYICIFKGDLIWRTVKVILNELNNSNLPNCQTRLIHITRKARPHLESGFPQVYGEIRSLFFVCLLSLSDHYHIHHWRGLVFRQSQGSGFFIGQFTIITYVYVKILPNLSLVVTKYWWKWQSIYKLLILNIDKYTGKLNLNYILDYIFYPKKIIFTKT